MYISKYFTNEQIDERLLQGYYDDFVAAGFKGTKVEFFAFVLSIANKIDKEDGKGLSTNDFTNALKEKLDSIDEGAKLITRVSELENDAKYQTEEEVKAAINDLIGGASDALDTLKELEDALGGDANFATTITNRLTALQTAISEESTRAKQAETDLGTQITNEATTREAEDLKLKNQIDDLGTTSDAKIEAVNNKVEANKQAISDLKQSTTESLAEVKQYAHDQVDGEKDRALEAEAGLRSDLNGLKNKQVTDKSELQQAINAEEAARNNADTNLQSAIDSEKANREAADTVLTNTLDREVKARKEADEALEAKLSSQITTQSSNLSERITQEVSDRQNADLELKTDIVAETTERKSNDSILEHKISDLDSKVDASNTSLEGKLDAEIAARKTADTALDEAKVDKVTGKGLSTNDFNDILKNKLDGIAEEANKIIRVSELENDAKYQTEADVKALIEKVIDGAPGALDTLRELAEALGEDPNFATTLTNRINALAEQLNNEEDERTKGDTALQTQIGNEVTRATGVEDMLKEKIVQEVGDRKDAITEVKATIAANKVDSDGKISTLTEKVNTLDQAIDTQYNDLKENIANNTAAIQANLELIQHWQSIITSTKSDLIAKYEQEKADRIAADAELTKKLTDAIDDYTQKITDLQSVLEGKITAEKEAREAADDILQQNINNVSLAVTTEETARRAADEVLQNNITKEETDRKSADTALDGKITTEATTREQADTALDGKITAEKEAREAAVSAEETARTNADKAIQDQVDELKAGLAKETTDRTTADTALGGRIDNEENARQSSDQNIQDQVDTLKGRVDDIVPIPESVIEAAYSEIFGTATN